MKLAMVLLLAVTGCLPVRVLSIDRKTRLPSERTSRPIAGSGELRAEALIEADELVVTLVEERECEIVEIEQVQVHRDTIRVEGYPNGVLYEAGLMVVAGVTSWRVLADPAQACTSTNEDGTTSMGDPDSCRRLGQAIGVGALLIGAVVVLDLYRLRDSTTDQGVIKRESVVGREMCGRGPVADQDIGIDLPGSGRSLSGRTTSAGSARVSLTDLTAEELDRLDEGVAVAVGSRHTWVNVDLTDVAILRDQLAADPESRYGGELAEHTKRERDAARGQAEQLLRVNALDRLRHTIATRPTFAAALRGDAELIASLEEIISTTAAALLLESRDPQVTFDRFCAARWLVIELAGDARWRQLRDEIAARAAAISDDHTEKEFADALSTNACP